MKHHLVEHNGVRRNRILSCSARELVLLAPSNRALPRFFQNVNTDSNRYHHLLDSMQALRAAVYLQDGAISENQLTDGRHRLASDDESWHLLLLDSAGRLCGCARYREYLNNTDYSELSVSRSTLANCPKWGKRLQSAVAAELALSRRLDVPYVELGGWALHERVRCTTEALRIALSTYGLAQALGGGVGISTATSRNSSASILQRIGGRPLHYESQELPPYHDFHYGCEMRVLRFYSWAPNPRYADWIADVKAELSNVTVFAAGADNGGWAFRKRRTDGATLQFHPQTAVHHSWETSAG